MIAFGAILLTLALLVAALAWSMRGLDTDGEPLR